MSDWETEILRSIHAAGGRASVQQILQRVLRPHLRTLLESGDIARERNSIHGLTAQGCKRIGVKPHILKPLPFVRGFWVNDELGGVVEGTVDSAQTAAGPSYQIPYWRDRMTGSKARSRANAPTNMTKCPTCGVSVGINRLEKHKSKVHAGSDGSLIRNEPASIPTRPLDETEATPESLRQSDYESRFGDKYVGQVHRDDDGTFGSLPLYDDYGDESGPD
jgi:hypothetical protein